MLVTYVNIKEDLPVYLNPKTRTIFHKININKHTYILNQRFYFSFLKLAFHVKLFLFVLKIGYL